MAFRSDRRSARRCPRGCARSCEPIPASAGAIAQLRQQARLRHRPCEHVALADVAAHIAHHVGVGEVLEPFGNRRDPEMVRQRNHRPADAAISCVTGTSIDEAPVELELAERQLAQPCEGREALAEVVDGERDAVDAQLCGDLVEQRNILYDLALGNLEDQAGPVRALRPVLADQRRERERWRARRRWRSRQCAAKCRRRRVPANRAAPPARRDG